MSLKSLDAQKRLREMLNSGRFLFGSRLPAERILASELGVSRGALRKVLSALEAEGLIWRHVGRGTYFGVRPNPRIEIHSTINYATSPPEIMEVRLVIEPEMAAIAAQRSTPFEIEKMESCARRCEEAPDFTSNEKWDYLLHENIASATHNSFLASLYNVVNKMREGDVWGRLKEASMNSELWKLYSRQHHNIVKAIRDREPAKAEEFMRDHLESVKNNLFPKY
jgi:GntR family uxuAB operon transcriptional repressor